MRRILFAAAVLSAAPAQAQEAVQEAWIRCVYENAQRYAASSEAAEVAADGALGACTGEEEAVRARVQAIFRNSPAEQRAAMQELREQLRRDAISLIIEDRLARG